MQGIHHNIVPWGNSPIKYLYKIIMIWDNGERIQQQQQVPGQGPCFRKLQFINHIKLKWKFPLK